MAEVYAVAEELAAAAPLALRRIKQVGAPPDQIDCMLAEQIGLHRLFTSDSLHVFLARACLYGRGARAEDKNPTEMGPLF